jgi:hypothetical protein
VKRDKAFATQFLPSARQIELNREALSLAELICKRNEGAITEEPVIGLKIIQTPAT